jgi:hypothetical protein
MAGAGGEHRTEIDEVLRRHKEVTARAGRAVDEMEKVNDELRSELVISKTGNGHANGTGTIPPTE